jgi:small RNA 2'-O-methyltransferase
MHHQTMDLHEERLDHTVDVLRRLDVRRVLDLGCGAGLLLYRLMQDRQFEKVVGLELCGSALVLVRNMLATYLDDGSGRLQVLQGSYTDADLRLRGFDAAVMVETIEHVPPQALSTVESAVFGQLRPQALFMTTPNQDYNYLLGLGPDERRDEDHKFEWGRARFRAWATGVARRNAYQVSFGGIGEWHPDAGQPTQTALFTRQSNGIATT